MQPSSQTPQPNSAAPQGSGYDANFDSQATTEVGTIAPETPHAQPSQVDKHVVTPDPKQSPPPEVFSPNAFGYGVRGVSSVGDDVDLEADEGKGRVPAPLQPLQEEEVVLVGAGRDPLSESDRSRSDRRNPAGPDSAPSTISTVGRNMNIQDLPFWLAVHEGVLKKLRALGSSAEHLNMSYSSWLSKHQEVWPAHDTEMELDPCFMFIVLMLKGSVLWSVSRKI